jgi:putative (di)nucleoside polyphosphate hydrolase
MTRWQTEIRDRGEYRPNVAVLVLGEDGRILAGRRRGSFEYGWQVPQGGRERGETAEKTCRRELREETGLRRARILARTARLLRYDFPVSALKPGNRWRGQEQVWFLVRVPKAEHDRLAPSEEFAAFRWVEPKWLLARIVPFKRRVYRTAFAELLGAAALRKRQ